MSLNLTPEAKMFLHQHLIENKLSLEELVILFKQKFPHVRHSRINVENLRKYALQNISGWEERTVSGLEEIVEEEISKVPISEEFITDETKKIDQIQKHRQILKELWKNYMGLKFSKKQESMKARYLEDISKELLVLQELEESERGILSMLDEVRRAEAEESAIEHRDHLEGWGLPRLVKKCETVQEATRQLSFLQERVVILKHILVKTGDLGEAVKLYLKKLYEPKEQE